MSPNKIMGYQKIQNHPDVNAIVEKLISGVATRQIEGWLKQKYPKNAKNHISYISLQSYRKNYLDMDATVIKDLQKKRKDLQVVKRQEQQKEAVEALPAYHQGLKNFVQDSLIDYNSEMLRMMDECREGIEQLKIQNLNKGSHLNHQAIASYLNKYQGVIEMHQKMISAQEKRDAGKLEHDYERLTLQMEILVEAVKEVFKDTYPEGLSQFVIRVKQKMEDAGLV